MNDNGKMADDTPVLKAVLDKKTADGKPAYTHSVLKLNDTADPVALIRNAFTAQTDGNCAVVLAGPATNLAKVLDLPAGPDVIKRKVKLLSVAMGTFPEGRPDPHVKADLAAAKRLFAEWPTPIVAAGVEVGVALPYPGSSIEQDFAWAPAIPSSTHIGLSSPCRTMRRRRPWLRRSMPYTTKGSSNYRTPAPSAWLKTAA